MGPCPCAQACTRCVFACVQGRKKETSIKKHKINVKVSLTVFCSRRASRGETKFNFVSNRGEQRECAKHQQSVHTTAASTRWAFVTFLHSFNGKQRVFSLSHFHASPRSARLHMKWVTLIRSYFTPGHVVIISDTALRFRVGYGLV